MELRHPIMNPLNRNYNAVHATPVVIFDTPTGILLVFVTNWMCPNLSAEYPDLVPNEARTKSQWWQVSPPWLSEGCTTLQHSHWYSLCEKVASYLPKVGSSLWTSSKTDPQYIPCAENVCVCRTIWPVDDLARTIWPRTIRPRTIWPPKNTG